MAVPKKKTSKSKRDMRRSHDSISAVSFVTCENCGKPRLSHNICPFCSFYNGKNTKVASVSRE